MSAPVSLTLPPETVEEIARRAAQLVAEKPAATPEPWLTVEQAAAHLGVSTSQLYTLCSQRRRNGIPLVKEGSRTYFKASELDRWRERGGQP